MHGFSLLQKQTVCQQWIYGTFGLRVPSRGEKAPVTTDPEKSSLLRIPGMTGTHTKGRLPKLEYPVRECADVKDASRHQSLRDP